MEQLLEWAKGFDMVTVGIVVALALAAGWFVFSERLPSLGSLSNPFASDPDVADLQAVKRLKARAERLRCPEMALGVDTVLSHFFHEGGGH